MSSAISVNRLTLRLWRIGLALVVSLGLALALQVGAAAVGRASVANGQWHIPSNGAVANGHWGARFGAVANGTWHVHSFGLVANGSWHVPAY